MLVLSRKIGERITIGDNITVVIQRIAGGRVSLGVEAPREVSILRSELERHDGNTPREDARSGGEEHATAAPPTMVGQNNALAAMVARRSAVA